MIHCFLDSLPLLNVDHRFRSPFLLLIECFLEKKANNVAVKRLDLLKSLKTSLNATKDEIADESHARASLERMRTIQIEIKKERPLGRPGGSKRWLVHIVLLIC